MENISDRIVTCVYCGMQYPAGTPTNGESCDTLTDHIKICEKHPMRKSEEKIEKLKKALGDLIGSSDIGELSQMKKVVESIEDPEVESTLNAMTAFIEILQSEQD